MNARGERILIFGDSLTRHTSGEVWNVNAGSMRSSSAPGDLLASLLAEQGAAAVRTNARVSRSAWNFWGREAAGDLIAADLAWKPTKVIVMLGTNDVGIDPRKVRDAFTAIRDAYRGAGAEVWAIGPFISNKPPAGVQIVVKTMASVFGMRFIDGRPLSELAQRAGDGLHYTAAGARTLSLILADTLVRKVSPTTVMKGLGWGLLGIGVALVAGYTVHRKGLYTLNGDGAEAVGVDEDDVIDAEFTELGDVRGLLAAGPGELEGFLTGGSEDNPDRLTKTQRAKAKAVAATMADIIGDGGWKAVDLEQLAHWVDLDAPMKEITDVLLEQSVTPENCVPYGNKAALARIEKARGNEPEELEGAADDDDDDDENFGKDDWFERIAAKSAARKAGMREALAKHDAVFITHGTRKILLVKTPEMSNPEEGSIRVMSFDADGPIGHTTRKTLDKIADELTDDWHPDVIEPATMAEVDAFTSTEQFAKGSEAVIAVQKANAGLKGKRVKKLKCPECGGGLTMDDPRYGLTCEPCGVRVAGPFDDANKIPAYKRATGLKGSSVLRWKKISPGVYHATSPAGLYIIDGNNAGRNRWTVTYPGGDYGMVDALTEAKAWANQDAEGRAQSSTPGSIA